MTRLHRTKLSICCVRREDAGAADRADVWLTDESHVRKVIHEFNEEGVRQSAP